jgi:hypothetical protein
MLAGSPAVQAESACPGACSRSLSKGYKLTFDQITVAAHPKPQMTLRTRSVMQIRMAKQETAWIRGPQIRSDIPMDIQ